MFYITLNKVESIHGNMTTEAVSGLAPYLPQVGDCFFMYSDGHLTKNDLTARYIKTSIVQEVRCDKLNNEIVFVTENSVYALSNIKEVSPQN